MANINKSPVRMAGAGLLSGGINTSEIAHTYGGQQAFSIYSGGLITLGSGSFVPVANPGTGHAVIMSGPGRLKTFLGHQVAGGAAQLTFYDSNIVALSGVRGHTLSGRREVFKIFNTTGLYGVVNGGPLPMEPDAPFTNGLAVSAASGCIGFTVVITQETAIGSGAVNTQ